MSQEGLFTLSPYLAAGGALIIVGWRLFGSFDPRALAREARCARLLLGRSAAWKWGMAALLLGHFVGLAVPGQVLLWNQQPARVLALEITGLAFAGVALFGLAAGLRERRQEAPEFAMSPVDTILVTLLVVLLTTGIGMALLHRWASSWSAVAVAPYVRSLLRLAPEAHWMESLPFLARLHVLSFFALLAVWPLSSPGAWIARARRRLVLARS